MSPTVDGKFLHCGGERFWVKGVAYGTFAPTAEGGQFPSRERVADDFAMMARHGVNTVRTYTVRLQKITALFMTVWHCRSRNAESSCGIRQG